MKSETVIDALLFGVTVCLVPVVIPFLLIREKAQDFRKKRQLKKVKPPEPECTSCKIIKPGPSGWWYGACTSARYCQACFELITGE